MTGTFVKLQILSQANMKISIQTFKGKNVDWHYNQTDYHNTPRSTLQSIKVDINPILKWFKAILGPFEATRRWG